MKTGEGKRMARVRGERIATFREWWVEEMGAAVGGGRVNGVGGSDGNVEMGDGETAALNPAERQQLIEAVDAPMGDGESSGGESSSDSAS